MDHLHFGGPVVPDLYKSVIALDSNTEGRSTDVLTNIICIRGGRKAIAHIQAVQTAWEALHALAFCIDQKVSVNCHSFERCRIQSLHVSANE